MSVVGVAKPNVVAGACHLNASWASGLKFILDVDSKNAVFLVGLRLVRRCR